MRCFSRLAVILLVVSILAVSTTALTSAEGTQTWHLDSTTTSAGYQMERAGTPSGEVSVPSGGSTIWIAKEASETDITFPSGDWETFLCLKTGWAQHCDVEVGSWDGSTFTPFSTTDVALSWNSNQNEITVLSQMGAEPIKKDDYLALKITNNDGGSAHSVLTAGCSRLDSPGTDPGYPTPELTTAVLLGLGLLGLSTYIVIKRRRIKTAAIV